MRTSMPPHFASISRNALATWSSLVTSHEMTRSALTLSASGRTRFSRTSPAYEKARRAPCLCMASAMPQAMLRSLATPNTATRLSLKRSVMVSLLKHVERAFHVLRRIDAESDQRLRALQSFDLREPLGDDRGDLLPLGNANNRNQVPFAGDRVNFGHAFYAGNLLSGALDVISLGPDQYDGGNHVSPPVSLRIIVSCARHGKIPDARTCRAAVYGGDLGGKFLGGQSRARGIEPVSLQCTSFPTGGGTSLRDHAWPRGGATAYARRATTRACAGPAWKSALPDVLHLRPGSHARRQRQPASGQHADHHGAALGWTRA